MVVFLSKCDTITDPDVISLVELEVKDLLTLYGYPATTPFVYGSALEAMQNKSTEFGVPSILKLLEVVDTQIPTPPRANEKPFLMAIETTFHIGGRGTVATGSVSQGTVKLGEELEVVGIKKNQKTACTGIEMFRRLVDQGQAGDNLGVLLRKLEPKDIRRGMCLAKPGTLHAFSKFSTRLYCLTEEEGGRHKPFQSNYRPQVFIRTADVTGSIILPKGVAVVMPGDTAELEIHLIQPLPMSEGLRFSLREGGKTVGFGVIAKIIE
jgi:elongation factor Tu